MQQSCWGHLEKRKDVLQNLDPRHVALYEVYLINIIFQNGTAVWLCVMVAGDMFDESIVVM